MQRKKGAISPEVDGAKSTHSILKREDANGGVLNRQVLNRQKWLRRRALSLGRASHVFAAKNKRAAAKRLGFEYGQSGKPNCPWWADRLVPIERRIFRAWARCGSTPLILRPPRPKS
jgi:hypothetical protein